MPYSAPLDEMKIPPLPIVKAIFSIREALLKICKKMNPPGMEIMEMTQAFWVSKAIGVASTLGLADLLQEGAKSIGELAQLSGTNEIHLYRLMRMLASQGVFIEKPGKIFENSALSRTLLDEPNSMKYMVEHQTNANNWKIFGDLEQNVREGKNTNKKTIGDEVFEFLSKNKSHNNLYNKAMTNASQLLATAVLKAYSFDKIKKLVDVGGGHGILLRQIMLKYSKLEGVVFDLPHVIEDVPEMEDASFSGRISFVPGDAMKAVPEADAYILKSLLHAFGDEDCEKILKTVGNSAEKGASILIIEPLIGEPNKPTFGKLFDVQLMVGTESGRERTREEYESLIERSGLVLKKFIPTISAFTIIEATKK